MSFKVFYALSICLQLLQAARDEPFQKLKFVENINNVKDSNSIYAYAVPLNEAAESDGAVCIDGTPGRYYFSPGAGSGSNKYFISFQGGGWCSGLVESYGIGFDSCYHRSLTTLGTTIYDTEYVDLGDYSYFSNVQSQNPLMYNWNKVLIRYCDGASFSGNLDEPVVLSNNVSLYFRGFRIMKAAFENLLQNGLNSATDVVISGASAGGLATFLHADYVTSTFLSHVPTVVALPDSGYFMQFNGYNGISNYSNGIAWVFDTVNATHGGVNQQCLEYYKHSTLSNCMFAARTVPFIQTPIFILNSQYDSWQAYYILGTGTDNTTLLNKYGQNFTESFNETFISDNTNGHLHGAFIDSCFHHCGYWDSITYDNYTQATAFSKFYSYVQANKNKRAENTGDVSYIWRQNYAYPCDSCCY